MATDKRPTKAERKDDAKTRRLEEMKRRQRKAAARKARMLVIAALIIAGIAGLVVLSQTGAKKATKAIATLIPTAGCEKQQDFSGLTQKHVTPPATVQYGSKPPTGGDHYPSPDATGVHSAPIQAETQVHNLEHGHIVIQYKGIDDALITKLEALAKVDSVRVVVAPYNDMPYKVSITAWGHLIGCNNPNDSVVDLSKAFIKKWKGKGPEGDIPGTPTSG